MQWIESRVREAWTESEGLFDHAQYHEVTDIIEGINTFKCKWTGHMD